MHSLQMSQSQNALQHAMQMKFFHISSEFIKEQYSLKLQMFSIVSAHVYPTTSVIFLTAVYFEATTQLMMILVKMLLHETSD